MCRVLKQKQAQCVCPCNYNQAQMIHCVAENKHHSMFKRLKPDHFLMITSYSKFLSWNSSMCTSVSVSILRRLNLEFHPFSIKYPNNFIMNSSNFTLNLSFAHILRLYLINLSVNICNINLV